MKKTGLATVTAILTLLLGCAHNPNIEVGYYFARSKVDVKVVRTVACTVSNPPQPIVANTVTVTVTHAADYNARHALETTGLNGHLSDSDLKFDFFEDGRLRSINTVSTGQGEQIIKTAISVATTLAPILFVQGGTDYSKECGIVKQAAGGKSLTLTFEDDFDIPDTGNFEATVKPDATSTFYAEELPDIVGTVAVTARDIQNSPAAPVSAASDTKWALLKLKQPRAMHAIVTAGAIRNKSGDVAWEGDLLVAQRGIEYELPIPAPAIFGKETLVASFEESGALTSLHYTSENGTAQAINVLNAGLAPFQPTAKADRLKAEADLIVQQQRLVQCQADPANCK